MSELAEKVGGSAFAALAPRRNSTRMAAGALIVVLSALGGVLLFQKVGERQDVYVVARDVAVGARITESDLALRSISVDGTLEVVTPSQKAEIVGKFAAVPLKQNWVFNLDMVQGANTLTIGPNERLVGLALGAAARPITTSLSVGSDVDVIIPAQSISSTSSAGYEAVPAKIHKIAVRTASESNGSPSDSTVQIDVVVDQAQAARIAAAAKDGKAQIVGRTSGG